MTSQPTLAPAILVNLPKCNLHSHLEGSVRPATLWELAQEQGIDLGIPIAQLPDRMQVDGSERSLLDYLAKISLVYPVLKDARALTRTAYEAAEDAARDGVVYFELRAGPVIHSRPGLSVERVIESILAGLRMAEQKLGLPCGLIVAALRDHDPQDNLRLAKIAVDFKDEGVVGFDLAGDEAGYPASLHAQAFAVAQHGGLGITVHAGEAAGPENVRYAVEALQATRIGHGVRSILSPKVLDLLLTRQVTLEVCPTSNVHTRAVDSLHSHPVRKFHDRGIPVTIGDDDPTTSRTRVSRELAVLQSQFHFTLAELVHIQRMGIQAAFIPGAELQRSLLSKLEEWQSSHRGQYKQTPSAPNEGF